MPMQSPANMAHETRSQDGNTGKAISTLKFDPSSIHKTFICEFCNDTFDTNNLLAIHRQVHMKEVPEVPQAEQSEAKERHESFTADEGENQHPCYFCKKTWRSNSERIKHERVHTGEKPFTCSVCLKSFTFSSNLRRHKKECKRCGFSKHSDESLAVDSDSNKQTKSCQIESSACDKSNLKDSLDLPKRKQYDCLICKVVFNYLGTLRLHMTKTHPEKNTEGPYECSICHKTLMTRQGHIRHERKHAGEFKCSLCSKSFVSHCNLSRHMRESQTCFRNSAKAKVGSYPYKKKTHSQVEQSEVKERHEAFIAEENSNKGKNKHACSYCYKTWRSSSDRIKHERIHTGEKPFTCSVCLKSFVFSSNLRRHKKECKSCGYSKHSDESLEVDSDSNSNKPTKSDHGTHMSSHFKTIDTAIQFNKKKIDSNNQVTRSVEMYGSKNKDMNVSKGKKQPTPYFGRKRFYLGSYPKRRFYELFFQCSECGKSFVTGSALQRHMQLKRHSREKSFECSFCSKAFYGSFELVKHMRIHTGDKPYDCSLCSSKFTERRSLYRHEACHRANLLKANADSDSHLNSDSIENQTNVFVSTDCTDVPNNESSPLDQTSVSGNLSEDFVSLEMEVTSEDNWMAVEDGGDGDSISMDESLDNSNSMIITQSEESQKQNSRSITGFIIDGSLDNSLRIIELDENPNFCFDDVEAFLIKVKGTLYKLVEIQTREKTENGYSDCNEFINEEYSNVIDKPTRKETYNCDLCNIKFCTSDDLNSHIHTHTKEMLCKCSECGEMFKSKSSLETHIRKHAAQPPHSRWKQPYKIRPKVCDRSLKKLMTKDNLHRPVQNHTNKDRPKCIQCNKTFVSERVLNSHLRIHTGEKPHKCPECFRAFIRIYDLKYHMKTHSGRQSRYPLNEFCFQCSICENTFTLNSIFVRHFEKSHGQLGHVGVKPYKCSLCSETYLSVGGVRKHLQTHTRTKDFKCTFCSKTFRKKCHLQSHVRMHTGEKPDKCSTCGMFNEGRHQCGHMRTRHGGSSNKEVSVEKMENYFQCSICEERFSLNKMFVKHFAESHKGELGRAGFKPYKCYLCNQSYFSDNGIRSHMHIHTGRKDFKCAYCPRAFPRNCDLQSHVRTHMKEKKHPCSLCGIIFNVDSHLLKHMQIHHAGNSGKKVSKTASTDRVTGIFRESEYDFKCSICEERFILNKVFVKHFAKHHEGELGRAGFKPYKCSHCSHTYFSVNGVRKHIKRHIGRENN